MMPFILQALLGAGAEIIRALRALHFFDVMTPPLAKLLQPPFQLLPQSGVAWFGK